MLKVLLVDDEPFILQGLSMIIDWEANGFEIVEVASNAFVALEILQKKQIDLVITDIKMPKMTGLEMVEKVRRENLSDAYFVILSGYNDFNYVRNALQNNCVDYMLKPVEKEELLAVLKKVKEQYENNHKEKEEHLQSEKDLFTKTFLGIDLNKVSNENWTDKKIDKQKADGLIHAVEIGDKEEIEKGVLDVFEELGDDKADGRVFNMIVNYMLFRLIHMASEQDENVNQQEVFQFIINNALEQESGSDGKEGMKRLLSDYADYLSQLRGNQAKGVLGKIEADVKENFKENLTLKDLSRKYYVNAAYLGQIFKKQYGESFKDYLNRIRIERAVELLLHTDMKIYEIAEAIGYKDMDYFINKFIAINGCTPAKFRKQIK